MTFKPEHEHQRYAAEQLIKAVRELRATAVNSSSDTQDATVMVSQEKFNRVCRLLDELADVK